MKKIIFLISVFIMSTVNAATLPDFRYPETVINQSVNQIEKALKTGSDNELIDGIVKFSIAKSSISTDYIPQIITRTDTLAERADNKPVKAVLYSLEADMFLQYLENQRGYILDREQTAVAPDDITKWAIPDFHKKIKDLAARALVDRDVLMAAPSKRYSDIITPRNYNQAIFPSLYDLLGHHLITVLDEIGDGFFVMPIWRDYSFYIANRTSISPDKGAKQMVADIFADLLNVNAKNAPALIYTETQRILSSVDKTDAKYDCLYKLYADFRSNQYSSEPLIAMTENYDTKNIDKLYNIVKAHIADYPKYARINALKNFVANYEQPSASAALTKLSTNAEPIKIRINAKNITKVTVKAYKTAGNISEQSFRASLKAKQPVAVKVFDVNYKQGTDTLTVVDFPPLTDFGEYRFVIETHDAKTKKTIFDVSDVMRVTNIAVAIRRVDKEMRAYAIDAVSGRPLTNGYLHYQNKKSPGRLNRFGYCVLPDKSDYCWFVVGNDTSEKSYFYKDYDYSNHDTQINIYTDLGVYRPGDKVNFAFVAYRCDDKAVKLLTGKGFTAKLLDTNRKEVADVNLKTDKFGRADSCFVIPKNGMTGNFSICVADSAKNIEYRQITVSEYKAPTFFIELDRDRSQLTDLSHLTAAGKVLTFSNFPVADAVISYEINSESWLGDDYFEPIGGEITTDADGEWSLALPAEILAGNNYAYISLELNATAKSGETQSIKEYIAIGSRRFVDFRDIEEVEASQTAELPVRVIDITRNEVDASCCFELKAAEKTVKEGTFNSASPMTDLSGVQSGKYNLSVWLADDQAREDLQTKEIVVYRKADELPPFKTPLRVEADELSCDSTGTVIIQIKSSYATSIYFAAYTKKKVLIEGWHSVVPGLNNLDLPLKLERSEKAVVELFAVAEHEVIRKAVTVKPFDYLEPLKIVKETFRDFINPGAKEVWRFRLENTGKERYSGAMIAYMYDAALNTIRSNYPHALFNEDFRTLFQSSGQYFGDTRCYLNSMVKYLSYDNIQVPYINTYGRSIVNALYHRYGRFYAMPGVASNSMMLEKSMDYCAVMEECSEEKVLAKGSADAGGETVDMNDKNFRDPDVRTAFFLPRLAADSDGVITLEFDAPNVNTSWQFCAVAYTDDLKMANINEKVTANKPLMVQANLPRFVRSGDIAVVKASVMNNTSDTVTAAVCVTLFNPANARVLKTEKRSVALAPKGSEVVEIAIDKELTNVYSGIGYRIMAEADAVADGEQKVIPVLPAATVVVEAEPFYMKEKEQSVTKKLPKAEAGTVTIEYCDNPVWYCVTAMPSMISDCKTALALARNYYITTVSGGIVAADKSVSDALASWKNSDVLKSNLEKNGELKAVDLENTPWLTDAERETLSMQRVIDLTDPLTVEARKNKALSELTDLQAENGGFRWFKGSDPSYYISLSVLEDFGRLRSLGWLKDDAKVTEMVKKACAFVDAEVVKEIKKYDIAKVYYSSYFNYILVRSMFPEYALTGVLRDVKREVINTARNKWGDYSLSMQAQAALLLAGNGCQKDAEAIIESLRQKARKDDTIGYYWDIETSDKLQVASIIAQAFHKVNPADPDLDNIRRWILLTKETRNWGEGYGACDAVNAILATGTRWNNSNRRAPEITVGGKKIEAVGDKFLGYNKFVFDISEVRGEKLSIKRFGVNPAWGAVYLNYNAPMAAVTAKNSPEIELEKTFYRYTDGGQLEEVPAADFKLGDKIQVRLTVKAMRDMNYVTVIDERPAAFEPVDKVPVYDWRDGLFMLRETRDSATNIFINGFPKGTYTIKYDVYVNNIGTFSAGLAKLQCLYAPQLTAHSAGTVINVK